MSSSTAVQPNSFTACLLLEMSPLPYGALNVLVMEGSLNSPVKRRRESRYDCLVMRKNGIFPVSQMIS
jgi:hypothetical protein